MRQELHGDEGVQGAGTTCNLNGSVEGQVLECFRTSQVLAAFKPLTRLQHLRDYSPSGQTKSRFQAPSSGLPMGEEAVLTDYGQFCLSQSRPQTTIGTVDMGRHCVAPRYNGVEPQSFHRIQ